MGRSYEVKVYTDLDTKVVTMSLSVHKDDAADYVRFFTDLVDLTKDDRAVFPALGRQAAHAANIEYTN